MLKFRIVVQDDNLGPWVDFWIELFIFSLAIFAAIMKVFDFVLI